MTPSTVNRLALALTLAGAMTGHAAFAQDARQDQQSPAGPSQVAAPSQSPSQDGGEKGRLDGVKSAAMVGLPVFGTDGAKVGDVTAIKVASDGKLDELHVKTGGFLGIGAKTVKVPSEKVTPAGQSVRVALSTQDFGNLPVVAEKKPEK